MEVRALIYEFWGYTTQPITHGKTSVSISLENIFSDTISKFSD